MTTLEAMLEDPEHCDGCGTELECGRIGLCDDCGCDVCRECGEPNDDGEGWDGLCGNCADREFAEED